MMTENHHGGSHANTQKLEVARRPPESVSWCLGVCSRCCESQENLLRQFWGGSVYRLGLKFLAWFETVISETVFGPLPTNLGVPKPGSLFAIFTRKRSFADLRHLCTFALISALSRSFACSCVRPCLDSLERPCLGTADWQHIVEENRSSSLSHPIRDRTMFSK